jgi:broad specificity phosphatase PhoE
MLRIILVRPGATDYDEQHRIQGTLDVPLNELGRHQIVDQIEALRRLGPTHLFTSPSMSAQQTAEILGQALQLKPRIIDRLANIDLGLWQGSSIDDVKGKQPKVFRQWQEFPETVRPPEGETIAHAEERIIEVLDRLRRKHKSDEVALLVAPEPLASVIAHVITGRGIGNLWNASAAAGTSEVLEPAPSQSAPTVG